MEPSVEQLQVKIFADGADLDSLLALAANPLISGFTTNPTLMRKAGVTDFEGFARQVLEQIQDRPISFEVFSDDFDEMERQARTIATLGRQRLREDPGLEHRGRARRSTSSPGSPRRR